MFAGIHATAKLALRAQSFAVTGRNPSAKNQTSLQRNCISQLGGNPIGNIIIQSYFEHQATIQSTSVALKSSLS